MKYGEMSWQNLLGRSEYCIQHITHIISLDHLEFNCVLDLNCDPNKRKCFQLQFAHKMFGVRMEKKLVKKSIVDAERGAHFAIWLVQK